MNIEQMIAREFKMPFGRYKGETLEEIYIENVGYLEWLLENDKTYPHNQGLKEKIEQCFKEMRNVRIS